MKKLIFLLVFVISCTSINTNKSKIDLNNEQVIRVKDSKTNEITKIMLEKYLYSVVTFEMGKSFPIEALKAQAIAARTYALKNILRNVNKDFDVYNDTYSQVYRKIDNVDKKIEDAVNDTRGIIIVYNNKPIDALYHSSSGVKTKSAKQVYGNEVEYLQSVEDYTTDRFWEYSIKLSDLSKILNIQVSEIKAKFEDEISVEEVIINNETPIKVAKFRRLLGNSKLKSANFNMHVENGSVYFQGVGYGHGVGMSQHGAKYFAKFYNYTYDKILKHYYTGVELKKIY
ncbi:SpoIID/LytB domain-containing protein [Caviibacter abscessus]|uniref:SpoIID/LytB domain-containing protein n=1 Tax=Caviibacter abscessus TaxID=1766719 RepID=UPI000837FB5E|nr:SpoIID/LytB domain-containing protein [Caviibacter abscessus]